MDKFKKKFDKVWNERCKYFGKEPSPTVLPPTDKIIVIGDLHGDWNGTIALLRKSKLINKKHKWIGGDTILVQLGDQVDRCRNSGSCHMKGATPNDENSDIRILYYFTNLHKQAEKAGGAVYSIIGNHELMNVDGDMRYVSRKNLLEFSKIKKKKGNKHIFTKYDFTNKVKDDNSDTDSRQNEINKGMENRIKYFKPGNKLSNFLACTRKMILIIGNNLFVHGGLIREILEKYSVDNMNEILGLYLFNKLKGKSKYKDLLHNESSPLWNRILGNLNNITDKTYVKSICDSIFSNDIIQTNISGELKPLNIKRIFIGHTPQLLKGINKLSCNDKEIYYVDIGLSEAFSEYRNKYDKSIYQSIEINKNKVKIIK